MYSSSSVPRHQQRQPPTGSPRRASASQLQLQRNSRLSSSVSLAKAMSFQDENRPTAAHMLSTRQSSSGKARPASHSASKETAPSSSIPRRSSDKNVAAIRKPSATRPPLTRMSNMASKAALAEVTNLPYASQSHNGLPNSQQMSIRRPHSTVPQVSPQHPKIISITTSSTTVVPASKRTTRTQARTSEAHHRVTKSTSNISTTFQTTNSNRSSSDAVSKKPNVPQTAATRPSSLRKSTPPSASLSTARALASSSSSSTTNALQQQQTEIHRVQKPPSAPRLPPGARQQTTVRPPRTNSHVGSETMLRRSSRIQSSRMSIYQDQDAAMETPKAAMRTVVAPVKAAVALTVPKSSSSTSSLTRASTTTTRSGMRMPVPKQRRGAAIPAERPRAPRKRQPIIPAVPMFDSELLLDVDVEMSDSTTSRPSKELRRTVSDMMEMDALPDDPYYDPDPVFVSEYQADIFAYKRELEIKLMPDPDFMERQPELTWHYRVHLIEWLIQVHERFNLLQETLHLCINYLDRFLSRMVITVDKLQLAGMVALLLASKYEEIQSPSIQTLVELASNIYTPAQVRSAEIQMLRALQYDMGHPGPMSFLRRISRVDGYDVDVRTLSKYLLDVTLCDHRFIVVPSSMVAALAYRTSMLLLERPEGWTSEHERWSGYAESTLIAGVNVLLTMLERPELTHPVLFEKYQDPQLLSPSTYVQELGVDLIRTLHL